MEIKMVSVADIIPYENNPRHNADAVEPVKESIKRYGFKVPMILDRENIIVAGHTRYEAAQALGMKEVPVIYADDLTEEQVKEFRLVDNKTAEFAEWDFEKLDEELADIDFGDYDFGFDMSQDGSIKDEFSDDNNIGILQEKFEVPPFSVLDTRQGYWQERKKAWKEKIGDKGQARDVAIYSGMEKISGGAFADASILDPVLSELVCRWFMPNNGNTFDCFAGDTVFGYVSASLGNHFTGIELREEQADFNQAACNGLDATYICDDGQNVLHHIGIKTQDLFFSCPPYYDLEKYSDLPNDASNQGTYSDFYTIIDNAFTDAIKCLKDDRFAVVVCGDVRDKKTGAYYGFPDDIKNTFIKNKMILYNELILVDHVGTARLRAVKYMQHRKSVKVHQNVLVFYKGDAKNIKTVFPEIEVAYEGEDME